MDTIKGLARRATQSIREKVVHTEKRAEDDMLDETGKKIRRFQKTSETLCVKLLRAASLIEELGKIVRDVGEEYQKVPDLLPDGVKLADDVAEVGNKLVTIAQEHHKGFKTQGFDVLNSYIKDTRKLRDAEDTRRNNQLEYDFFHRKVLELRRDPPKDTSRLPRNEQILENWRVELWRATENSKAICSQLYTDGRSCIDLSVLTFTQVLGSYFGITGGGFKQFLNARLPVYTTAPLLPPAPLPPNPLPPYQPPMHAGVYGNAAYGKEPQQGWQQQQQPPYAQQQQQQQQHQGWQQGQPVRQEQNWTQSQQSWQQSEPPSLQQRNLAPSQPRQEQQWTQAPGFSTGIWKGTEQPVEWRAPTPISSSSPSMQAQGNKLWTLTPIVDEHVAGSGTDLDGNGNFTQTS